MAEAPLAPGVSANARMWGRVVLYALVPGLICVDLINGALNPPGKSGGVGAAAAPVSPGTIIRGLLTLLAVIVILRARSRTLAPKRRWFLALAILGVLGPTLGYLRGGGLHDFVADMMDLSKVLYAPAMIVLFVLLLRRARLTLEDVLAVIGLSGALAGASIVLGNAAGIGLSTYMWQQTGFKGLFISQNELGLTMGISLFASVQLTMSTGRLRYLVMCLLTVAGMLLLGTRAAALGVFAAPIGVLVVNSPRLLSGRRRHVVLALVALLCVGLAGAAAWEYELIHEQRFEAEKFQSLVSRDVIFVRGVLIVGSARYLAHRSVAASLVGEGTVRYQHGVAEALHLATAGKAAEVDWLDLIGGYGVMFTLVLYGFYTRFVRGSKHLTALYGRRIRLTVLMMLGWFLAHSLIAGHAVGPMPAGTLAPLLAYTWLTSDLDEDQALSAKSEAREASEVTRSSS